jgi:glycosyltransferase involved in cell wall biosynthesis
LIAREPAEWADRVLNLLDDEPLAQRLADAGRAVARDRFRWEQRVQPLARTLDYLFEQRDVVRLLEGDDAAATLAPVLAES